MAIMVADHLNVTRCKISQFSRFEAMCCKIISSSFCAQDSRAIPHYSSGNMSSFPGELFILGDFILHLDSLSNHTNTFSDLLTYFGLRQHTDFPTHIHGHWLNKSYIIPKHTPEKQQHYFGIASHILK